MDARVLFVRYLLERMVRLSYVERVQRDLPKSFVPLLPPKPVGKLDWEAPGAARDLISHVSVYAVIATCDAILISGVSVNVRIATCIAIMMCRDWRFGEGVSGKPV